MFYVYRSHGCGPRGRHAGRHRWGGVDISFEVDGGGMGSRGRRRMFDGDELRLVLLKLIADTPRHGYDLIREIETITAGGYAPSPGVVYPTLTLLDDMGLIKETQSEGAKKQFAATDAGRAHLEERSQEVEALFDRLRDLGAARTRSDASSVRRAMHNLRVVLTNKLVGQRLDRDGGDQAMIDKIVTMIDDLSRAIERLD